MIAPAGFAPGGQRPAQLGKTRGFDQFGRPGPGPGVWQGKGRVAGQQDKLEGRAGRSALSARRRGGPRGYRRAA